MSPSRKQSPIMSIVGAIVAVAPLAMVIGHELVESKPYKIVGQPLQGSFALAGIWLPMLVIGVAGGFGFLFAGRHLAFGLLAGTAASLLVALASVVALTLAYGQGIPAAGDFGTNAVLTAFSKLAGIIGLPSLCFAALLGVILQSIQKFRGAAV